ncbi:unnamed protein product [Rotaria sp. Silwood2]|nr:unnamed protein product [Rotaria sp. Silwood2]CAF4506043.1 unnamed protein product [Rotaria sp. Silwood2]CAF4517130.1 unnamed protein product [Rotaria sp. Silwood2]
MLIVVILLVVFAPALLHRCTVWKSKSQLKHRNHIMKKLNIVEPPPHSDVEMQSPLSLPTVSSVVPPPVPTLKPSYGDLSQKLEVHKKLVVKLTRDLEAEPEQQKPYTSSPFSKIT